MHILGKRERKFPAWLCLMDVTIGQTIEIQVITEADVYLLVYCIVANILAMLTEALFIVRH